MTQVFQNNAHSTLRSNLTDSATTVELQIGEASRFPAIAGGSGDFFLATLQDINNNYEIVKVIETGTPGADDMTIERDIETVPGGNQPFVSGDLFEIRNTAGTQAEFLQASEAVLTGDMDGGGFDITDVTIAGPSSNIQDCNITNATGDVQNAINIPADSAFPPTAGTTFGKIWTEGELPAGDARYFPVKGMITMWWTTVPPSGWALCDGTVPAGSTAAPDLRGMFIVGYDPTTSGDYEDIGYDQPSGVTTKNGDAYGSPWDTSENGGHNHGGIAQPYDLKLDEMPSHRHGISDDTNEQEGGNENAKLAGPGVNRYSLYEGGPINAQPGEAAPHQHDINNEVNHKHTIDKRPPYVVLAYIIRLGDDGTLD